MSEHIVPVRIYITIFFVLLLWNTWAARPDRSRLLRSLAVLFGGAFILKYIVLASLYDPQGGLTKRVLTTLLEGAAPAGGHQAYFETDFESPGRASVRRGAHHATISLTLAAQIKSFCVIPPALCVDHATMHRS